MTTAERGPSTGAPSSAATEAAPGIAAPVSTPASASASGTAATRGGGLTARLSGRAAAWSALAALLIAALGLRLWGIWSGLPYAYNTDEDAHFVPRAIGMFGHDLNPHYFANPPAFTYVLHLLYAVWFGGRTGVSHEFALHPGDVFVVGRLAAALLGVLAIWLLYLLGARLFGRGVALLSAAIEAFAFLPVFYSHLALNDVPTLAPLTLSMIGSAGVLRHGRRRDYLLSGVGLGLACATKYTAGIVLLCLLAAATVRYLDSPVGGGRRVLADLTLAGAAALAAFLLADPYSLLDFRGFRAGLAHQSRVSSEAAGKLGASQESGVLYYLWSMSWGLGWAPSIAALGGAIALWRHERRLWWVLVPVPIVFLAFMGVQGRYYGRWLLPIFPVLCLLAAFFALRFAEWIAARARRPAALRVGVAAGAAILLAQGLLYSIHSDLVLSRQDTRSLARAWMVAHLPAGTRLVVEPVMPDEWAQDAGRPTLSNPAGYRWVKYHSLRDVIGQSGRIEPAASHVVYIEDYERTLSPRLIPWYERLGYCWVLTGSQQWGRAFADPSEVPGAIAYYSALRREGEALYRVSPYAPGERPVRFNFDWSFDYYPLAYERPGPQIVIYRLHGGRCR